ncbi:MAG: hypothetical protein PHD81_03035 [Candidatus Nanoarchaeia archaeon]|nr:hypothetical protein [Candidatus Nanoarchaeia archaeon]MDD5588059.1 hypothetical protein [Candidatus Nanoarchaeia archaeon]
MNEKLTYEDLKLGEKAKEAFLKGESTEYIIKSCPVYLNTNPVFGNLNATDLVIAAVLGNVNTLLVGDTGTGKTQLAKDIYNYYFNGNKAENGNGILIRGKPELDINSEIFTKLNISQAQRELTDNIDSLIYLVDELNRSPAIGQNQFFGLGDGVMDFGGKAIRLGKDGYSLLLSTANLGNGEFQGTFETDKALYNRLAVAIDFDYSKFKPTQEDRILIDLLRAADPRVKEAPKRDITEKIMQANREIEEISRNPGLEALAVINFLKFGLDNCQKYNSKEKIWPLNCQACDKNKGDGDEEVKLKEYGICSLIRAPVERTTSATLRYAAALQYLMKLKNPNEKINTTELLFKAFEMTGAYQSLLNPTILKQDYYDQNPKMMADVVDKLKKDYAKAEKFIIASLEAVEQGKKVNTFFVHEDRIGNYEDLSNEAKRSITKIDPFTDRGKLGYGWVNTLLDLTSKLKRK